MALTKKQLDSITRAAAKAGLTVPAGLSVGMSPDQLSAWVKKAWSWIWANRKHVWEVIKMVIDLVIASESKTPAMKAPRQKKTSRKKG